MTDTSKKARGTPNGIIQTQGSVALKAMLGGSHVVKAAAELTTVGQTMGVSGVTRIQVYQWANGLRRPLIDTAAVIEAWSHGAIPMVAWTERIADSGPDTDRAIVKPRPRASSRGVQGRR